MTALWLYPYGNSWRQIVNVNRHYVLAPLILALRHPALEREQPLDNSTV